MNKISVSELIDKNDIDTLSTLSKEQFLDGMKNDIHTFYFDRGDLALRLGKEYTLILEEFTNISMRICVDFGIHFGKEEISSKIIESLRKVYIKQGKQLPKELL